LFHSIKPLFVGKPLLVLVNKIDVVRPENVDPDDWALIQSCVDIGAGGMPGTQVVPMSTLTDEGVSSVKQIACDALLESRVEKKLRANRVANNINRLHVAMPKPRDNKVREIAIPETVADTQHAKSLEPMEELSIHDKMQKQYEERMAEEEKMQAMWARGEVPDMNTTTWKEKYLLKNPEWRFDIIPEILDGKNIADFVDPEIDAMLEELEREEDERMEQIESTRAQREAEDHENSLDEQEKKIVQAIRKKKAIMKHNNHIEHSLRSAPRIIRNRNLTMKDLENQLKERGFDEEQAEGAVEGIRERSRSRSRDPSRVGRKRERSASTSKGRADMLDLTGQDKKKFIREERSRSRTRSLTPAAGSGLKDIQAVEKVIAKSKASLVLRNRFGKVGESDRHIADKKPKHLFSGKRGIGKTQRR